MFFITRKKTYNTGDGPVRYLDGSSLQRPFDMQKPQLVIMGIFVVAAILIGWFLVTNILGNLSSTAARAQVSVEQNLARPSATTSLPSLATLFPLEDAAIRETFEGAGYVLYDLTKTEGDAAGMLDIMKLPEDVSLPEASLLYGQGISNLSAANAALLLNGSWRFSVDRGDYTDMRVKYADFASGGLDAAIQAAIAAEGFDPGTIVDSGVDDAGNTFQAGSIMVNDTVCNWKISAIALSSAFKVKGLPETAVYVGIRLYPQA